MANHKKPTTTAHRILFSKGTTTRQSLTLSSDKPIQEIQVIAEFARLLNEAGSRKVASVEPLAEADHDALATIDDQQVIVQLAELVNREWLRDKPPPNQRMGVIEISLSGDDRQHRHVDLEAHDDALRSLIARKLAKSYAKPEGGAFWLLIFTTSTYRTVYGKAGQLVISPGLERARDFLADQANVVFDEIWFTDLQQAPTMVWPRGANEPPVDHE